MFTPATAQQGDDTVSLSFWHPYTDERQTALERLVDEFNTSHEGAITVQAVGFTNSGLLYDQMLLQLQNPLSLPNVVIAWPHEVAVYDFADTIVDLASYTDAVSPQGTNPTTSKLLGLPDRAFYPALIINLDALYSMGVDTPPTTLNELQTLACQFRQVGGWSGGKFGVAWGYQFPLDAEVWLGLLSSQPEPLIVDTTLQINTSTAQQTIQSLLDVQAAGCMTPVALSTDAILTFAEGRALFYLGGSSSVNLVRQTIAASFAAPFEIGVYPLWGETVLTYGPLLSIIHHDAGTNAAAWTFIDWWQQPAQHQRWLTATNTPPIPADWNTLPLPAWAGYDVVRLQIRFTLQQLLANTLSIEDGLADLQTTTDQIFNDFAKEPD